MRPLAATVQEQVIKGLFLTNEFPPYIYGGAGVHVEYLTRELAKLIGVEDRMFVEVEGHGRVYAIADEDLERENDEKTSAVHFVRFELTAPMCAAVKAGAGVKLGCDHANYPAHTAIAPEPLASLAGDLH